MTIPLIRHLQRVTIAIAPFMAIAAHAMAAHPEPQKIIIDTDIGDAFDDALVAGLALSSRELRIAGITTAWGDTALRARLAGRLLGDVARRDIPVAAGVRTRGLSPAFSSASAFTQADFARGGPVRQRAKGWPDAVDFLLEQIRRHPGEITVIAIAPLTNLAAAIDRDPGAFRKLRRIVMMGGSIRRGYGASGRGPDAEYNIAMDVGAARKVFASGVPLFVMPLDAAQYRLDAPRRRSLLRLRPGAGARTRRLLADLRILHRQWAAASRERTVILYDVAALAYALDPRLCEVTSMRIEVDEKGFTRPAAGPPNSFVCLRTNRRLFDAFMPGLGSE